MPTVVEESRGLKRKLAFMKHLTGFDESEINVIPVQHDPTRIAKIQQLQAQHQHRLNGYLTLDEAVSKLDVTVLRRGFKVLWDMQQGIYVGLVNYRYGDMEWIHTDDD